MPCLVPSSVRLEAVTPVSAKDSLSACDNVQAVRGHQCFEGIGCPFFTLGQTVFYSEGGVRIYLRNLVSCLPDYMI